jgi:hypothetical protein
MNKHEKATKLKRIGELLQDIYPDLDTVLVTDTENPESITFMTRQCYYDHMQMLGLDAEEVITNQEVKGLITDDAGVEDNFFPEFEETNKKKNGLH